LDLFAGICGTLYCCIAFYDAEHSRSGRAGPIRKNLMDRGRPNHQTLRQCLNVGHLAIPEEYFRKITGRARTSGAIMTVTKPEQEKTESSSALHDSRH
jgi:hypothetical protein